jgi:hypothetical protein
LPTIYYIAEAESFRTITFIRIIEHPTVNQTPLIMNGNNTPHIRKNSPRILITDKEGIIRVVYTDDPLATYQELAKDIDAVLIDKLSGNER